MTSGLTPAGELGEVTFCVAKQGSTLIGTTDVLGIAMSLGLQAGAPLEAYVEEFAGTRYPQAGPTDDPEVPEATSIVDYVARRLDLDLHALRPRAGHRRRQH